MAVRRQPVDPEPLEEPATPLRSDAEELVERLQQGDVEALGGLVDRYAPQLGRLLGALLDDPHLVDDLVMETFLRAHRGAVGYRGGEVGAWLGRIAVNAARDQRRRGWWQRVQLVADASEHHNGSTDSAEHVCLDSDSAARVRAAVARLPQPQAEAIRLRFLAGEKYPLIAELLNLPESTVRSRVKAGLARLKGELAELA